ncbi:MAG TPA: phosphate/phosphite/phosphonate ABC transporter substrate-binding protein [Polyangiaceae bacterium]|jgi:phosphonate transport system substrate-binding protein|nr:phosphate/phosphite/phosphonate ABC transporter substrate-binding protein [Polyangiaceae bacterium]HNZ25035.1 phosphate/phosphite/phosphonate ABC transporter substrate-binding protein [Polyangiaceae bacterium]HOD23948.1 phosphate/phosphite/phosphonate ABC transporter substrate-binding protein [Polyangiaceae bacterium]HOE51279.1 phosphate/phosphite/phosphonate ABC transporter substrate-binding protein [Polyangiaceae bacterium]HOR37513.1 phosphate/phosphite/phosphonate ABC transporter substrat
MHTLRRYVLALPLLLWIVVATSACKKQSTADAATSFVFVLSPSYHAEPAKIAAMQKYVEENSGLKLEIRMADSQANAVASVGAATADAWLLPLFDYLFCHQEYGVHAGLRLMRSGTGSFHGVIVTRADGPIEKLDQLAGKTIAFVDRYSTSGFVYPAKSLRQAGVKPTTVFAQSHKNALEQLRTGKVDAAATYARAVEGDTSLRVIATTDPIPNEPIFFRSDLDAEKRDKFIRAMTSFASTPEGQAVLRELSDIDKLEPVDDQAYQAAHDSIRGADLHVQDLIPGGWWMHHENRAPLSAYAP